MRRNCRKYKEDIKAGRVTPVGMYSSTSSSTIHMIEINQASYGTWVFDTGCGSHLCNHLQDLRNNRPLVRAMWTFELGTEHRWLRSQSAHM